MLVQCIIPKIHAIFHLFFSGNQSVLSTSYKILVDVPDPPMEDENSSRENSGNDDSDDQVFEVSRAKSPLPAKIHHLFVKVPPKQTAKFERMVSLEFITI